VLDESSEMFNFVLGSVLRKEPLVGDDVMADRMLFSNGLGSSVSV